MRSGQGPLHHRADHFIQHSVERKLAARAPDPDGPGQELQDKGSSHPRQHVLPEAGGGGGLRQLGLQSGDGVLQYSDTGPQPNVVGDEILEKRPIRKIKY